jgi:hypothetical protein
MNVGIIAVTVWLVLAWIGLVFLIAKTGRNRRAHAPRPSPIDKTRRNRRPGRRRSSRRHQGDAPYYWAGVGGGTTGDWNQDEKREEWGGGDWGGGSFGGGDSGGGDSGGGDWGGGSFGGGDSGGGDSGGGDSGGGGD